MFILYHVQLKYIFITQSIMDSPHLDNQSAEFLSDSFKILSREVSLTDNQTWLKLNRQGSSTPWSYGTTLSMKT